MKYLVAITLFFILNTQVLASECIPIEYKVIQGVVKFEHKVNALLKLGWHLHGGMSIVYRSGNLSGKLLTSHAQAMVRCKSQDEE